MNTRIIKAQLDAAAIMALLKVGLRNTTQDMVDEVISLFFDAHSMDAAAKDVALRIEEGRF